MPTLFGKNLRMIGLSVGSREMFEQMVAAIDKDRHREAGGRS